MSLAISHCLALSLHLRYEVKWLNKGIDSNTWYSRDELVKFHKLYEKMLRIIDVRQLRHHLDHLLFARFRSYHSAGETRDLHHAARYCVLIGVR